MLTVTITDSVRTSRSDTLIIPLSPYKRKRDDTEVVNEAEKQHAERQAQNAILIWTKEPGGIATCTINDLFNNLRPFSREGFNTESVSGNVLFYYLGRVPLSVVRIVALVVGVLTHEKRNIISVDDGTGVIECIHYYTKDPTLKTWGIILPPKIGEVVEVVGRPHNWHGTRQLNVDTLVACKDINDEPKHWSKVAHLHATYYFCKEIFVLPPPATTESTAAKDETTPRKSRRTVDVPSSVSSASTSAVDDRTPTKLSPDAHKPCHPKHVKPKYLNSDIFRSYVKYYMDSLSHDALDLAQITSPNSTPTPRRKTSNAQQDRTPRASTSSEPLMSNHAGDISFQLGCTMSYLRRVPELSLFARRIVLETHRQKGKEARRKLRETARAAKTKVDLKTAYDDPLRKEQIKKESKKLFVKALRELWGEARIIVWDGRQWPIVGRGYLSNMDWIWNTPSSARSLPETEDPSQEEDEDVYFPSDPEPDTQEEAFLPLTTLHLADKLYTTLRKLFKTSHTERQKFGAKVGMIGGYMKAEPPDTGEMVRWLWRDEVWCRVGEIHVAEALEELRKQRKVYRAGEGRWKVIVLSGSAEGSGR